MTSTPCRECATSKNGTRTRGLCDPCYKRNHHADTLGRYPVLRAQIAWRPCRRCGIRCRTIVGKAPDVIECQDCRDVTAAIAPAEPIRGQWVRNNLTLRHQPA